MSDKIQITIECTGEEIEQANFLLAQAYEQAENNEFFLKYWKITAKELKSAEKFREKFLAEYLKLF